MRLLILGAVLYFVYKALKALILPDTLLRNKSFDAKRTTNQIDDVMVKDPYCGVYFPKRDGIHLKAGDRNYYFCSKECRDKYLDLLQNK